MDVFETQIPGLPAPKRGKVRDVYDLGDRLLLVATDRLSAFDVVMGRPIPDKGRILTQISRFWFENLQEAAPSHFISADWEAIAGALAEAGVQSPETLRPMLEGRSTLGLKTKPFPIEFVARGFLAGSLWKEYKQAGGPQYGVTLHGVDLPPGLLESSRLPQPVFTPATKAEEGHDINISAAQAREIIGDAADTLAARTLRLFAEASDKAAEKGLLLADTKFEFGERNGVLSLIDEALTPDSSRFWDADLYEPGKPQPSFDKQFVRDYLDSLTWDKQPPAPELPDEIVSKTAEKYREAYRRLLGKPYAL